MDATPSFGVTMISEVPSNPQLTFVKIFNSKYEYGKLMFCRVGNVFQCIFLKFKLHKIDDRWVQRFDISDKKYGSIHLFSHLYAYLLMVKFTS